MPQSMTGYGSSESAGPLGRFRAELRGINGRFLEIRVRIPSMLAPFEADFRKAVAENFRRGRLDLSLSWEPSGVAQAPIVLNMGVAKAYLEATERLRCELRLGGELGLAELLSMTGVVEIVRAESANAELRDLALEAVGAAALRAAAMRQAEGEALAVDIGSRLVNLARMREKLAERSAGVPVAAQRKLQDRLSRLGVEGSLDPARLAQEVAYLADKSDIAEELARLDAHIERCRATLANGEPAGKTLEFLTQELNREVNTIGSKSADIEISGLVLDMKSEIERVREQVLNLE